MRKSNEAINTMMKTGRVKTAFIQSAVFVFILLTLTASQTLAQQASFSLRALDSGSVAASELRGKVVVLAVGASWLPLSEDEVKSIKQLSAKYAQKNVEFFWVFTDSESPKSRNYASDESLKSFAKTHSLSIRLLRDSEGVQMKRLGVTQVPAFLILGKNGIVFGSPIEGIDPEGDSTIQLENSIQKALVAK